MELKQADYSNVQSYQAAFNRTIMELKLPKMQGITRFKSAFNRTIMELKQGAINQFVSNQMLLIAPLWN